MARSDRRQYLACHLTQTQRSTLKAEAERRGMSMSELAALFIATGLSATGATEPPEEMSREVDVPLPLEAK